MIISRLQIKAALTLLEISVDKFCEDAHLKRSTINRYLTGTVTSLKEPVRHQVQSFFENKRIIFAENDTVGFKPNSDFEVLRGRAGFETFMDDVYETMKSGGAMSLYNTEPEFWVKYLGQEWYEMHNKRMSAIKEPITIRNAIKEGNQNYILTNCQYRWIPETKWKNTTFYAFGHKLALLKFGEHEDDIKIRLITGKDAVEAYLELFETAWEHNTIPADGAPTWT